MISIRIIEISDEHLSKIAVFDSALQNQFIAGSVTPDFIERGWLFDQTLLALPVIAVAGKRANALGRLSGNPVAWYTALNCILMLVMALPTLNLLPAPIFLAVWLRRQSNKAQAAPALVVAS